MGVVFSYWTPSKYRSIEKTLDGISKQNKKEFKDYIYYKRNRSILRNTTGKNNENYLLYFIKTDNSDLLEVVLSDNIFTIKLNDIAFIDNDGCNILFYISTTFGIRNDVLNKLVNCDAFNIRRHRMFKQRNKSNQHFITFALNQSKINNIILEKLIQVIPCGIDIVDFYCEDILSQFLYKNNIVLVRAWLKKILSACNNIDNLTKLCHVPYIYNDIFYMSAMFGEDYLMLLIDERLNENLNINIKHKIYTVNGINKTLFTIACERQYENYVKYATNNKVYTNDCIVANIIYISTIIPCDHIADFIADGSFPHNVLEVKNNKGNTLCHESIIQNWTMHKKLLENQQITTSVLKHVDLHGNNCIILSALYDKDFLPHIYNYSRNIPDVILMRNNQGIDFIDVLIYQQNESFIYMINFFDASLYDFKNELISKFTNNHAYMPIDECVFLRYQYNMSVPCIQDIESIPDDDLCIICSTDNMNVQFDCSHKLCFKCSLQQKKCPLCDKNIKEKNLLVSI